MANSTLRIVFSEQALTTDDLLNSTANFKYTHNTDVFISETFVNLRVVPYTSTIGSGNKPTNLRDALLLDYPDLFTAVLEGDDTVLITSNYPNTTFTITFENILLEYIIDNETVVEPDFLVVTGLDSDRYLINNEINVDINSNQAPVYYKTVVQNLTNQQVSTNLISYPDSSFSTTLGLQSIIKSLFTYPSDADGYAIPDQIVPNSNKFKFSFYYNAGEGEILGLELVRDFIRGGERTTLTNRTIAAGVITPCVKLPIWRGYDTAEYYIDSQNLIRKRLLADVDISRLVDMRPKGCNEVYLKFLNQNGGYSNWLFESHSTNESNNNQGGFIRNNKVDDLGNEADYKMQVQAKVPKDYIQLILDLIVSPEIYAMIEGVFVRVRSGRNSRDYDNIKRAYAVVINFEVDNRFNPSLLWSN